ncbi:hypothetical protein [Deinococcus maricopensis]|uniref:Uncharacterized protein n=1 Tax=Deinococcus maricopensis (strain DSM 21211 / LMG 22137 / NRRL B-23946 / LB-34) TaxID=709986 RepID=E8U6H9_DEIML|nr:hypothetical protein [Deinococcus maricopensis]ADV66668.1 hypothetical protein Deima_1015 [Deinococcus maricopensis DSM 21211]
MRNFVSGCLLVAVLALLAVGAGAYFLVYVPARDFVQNTAGGVLAPRAGGPAATTPLTRAQVQQFVRVRRDVRAALGDSFTRLEGIYQAYAAGRTPGVQEVVGALREAGSLVSRGRAARDAALRREGLSVQRYEATRDEVNRALGVPQVDLAVLAEALRSLRLPSAEAVTVPSDPRSAPLITPFRAELLATAPLGLLGL